MAQASENPTEFRSRAMFVLVPAALLIIGASVFWKLNHQTDGNADRTVRDLRPSPSFELPNQENEFFRLESYLHRHRIVVVFFDGERGATADPLLSALNQNHEAVESRGYIVLGVSTALPQQNRDTKFKIPLLTDVNPAVAGSLNQVHRDWGVLDENGKTVPSVFYINRLRQVDWAGEHPAPINNPAAIVRAILEGRDPEALL